MGCWMHIFFGASLNSGTSALSYVTIKHEGIGTKPVRLNILVLYLVLLDFLFYELSEGMYSKQ